MQLVLQSTWKTMDPAELLQVQQWAMTLISSISECETPPFACYNDFTGETPGSWSNVDEGAFCTPADQGEFLPSFGWHGTHNVCGPVSQNALVIHRFFSTPITIDSVAITFNLSKGAGTISDTNDIFLLDSGTVVASKTIDWRFQPDGDGQVMALFGGPWTINEMFIALRADEVFTPNEPGGEVFLTQVAYEISSGDCTS